MLIRRAELSDLEAITGIYNEAVLNTTAAFDTEPKTLEERKGWFLAHDERHPVLVAEEGGAVLGWASLSTWSDRCAYAGTVEDSVYVRPDARGRGIGRALLDRLLMEGEKEGFHTVIARIVAGNESSIRLHASRDFAEVGVMREVGRKFGKLLDVLIMQKIYREWRAG